MIYRAFPLKSQVNSAVNSAGSPAEWQQTTLTAGGTPMLRRLISRPQPDQLGIFLYTCDPLRCTRMASQGRADPARPGGDPQAPGTSRTGSGRARGDQGAGRKGPVTKIRIRLLRAVYNQSRYRSSRVIRLSNPAIFELMSPSGTRGII